VDAVPALFDQLYTYAWFVGFAVALVTHTALMRPLAPRILHPACAPRLA
jgi:cytosine/uracil/thiamine/allantoin permease